MGTVCVVLLAMALWNGTLISLNLLWPLNLAIMETPSGDAWMLISLTQYFEDWQMWVSIIKRVWLNHISYVLRRRCSCHLGSDILVKDAFGLGGGNMIKVPSSLYGKSCDKYHIDVWIKQIMSIITLNLPHDYMKVICSRLTFHWLRHFHQAALSLCITHSFTPENHQTHLLCTICLFEKVPLMLDMSCLTPLKPWLSLLSYWQKAILEG